MSWRFSIRGLLFAVAFVSIACAALKYAGPVWWAVLSTIALLALMGSAIVAAVGKGEQRAKGLGLIICSTIYGAILFFSPGNELHSRNGYLPTTIMLRPLVQWAATNVYVDLKTGLKLPDYSRPQGTTLVSVEPTYVPSNQRRFPVAAVGVYSPVETKDVLRIGHVLWALLLGMLGAQFAGFVYRRKE